VSVYWLKYQGSRIALRQGETVVGRSPYCSIVVNSRRVSRQHCALSLRGALLTVTDLGSANGTWINGEAVLEPTTLSPGDLLEIGDEALEVLHGGTPQRDARDTERDLPIYHRDSSPDSEPSTITQVQTASVALIESLVANGSGARSPSQHFAKVQRAVDKYLNGKHRIPTNGGRLELDRLRRSIEATARLDGSHQAADWRRRVLTELSAGVQDEQRPER
jgi:pSer/pThr/pTyr-binding forkhead associated (FHA) protein